MEDAEIPTERIQEHLEHHAHATGDKWVSWIALSTAILAALAAVTALFAGDHANEAILCQMEASDQWGYYQAKGIKSGVLNAKMDILRSAGQPANKDDAKKAQQYTDEQKEIKETADKKETESREHLSRHVTLARGVTMFQIAIATAAISALTRRPAFWLFSLGCGAVGLVFLAKELLRIANIL